jgi:hypothetical protein
LLVWDNLDLRESELRSFQQARIMVDNQNDLIGWQCLIFYVTDRFAEHVPPLFCVRAHYDGDRAGLPISKSMCNIFHNQEIMGVLYVPIHGGSTIL